MSMMVMISVGALCLAVLLLTFAAFGGARQNPQIQANLLRGLRSGAAVAGESAEAPKSWIAQTAARLTPQSRVKVLENLMIKAGRPPEWPLERLVAAKVVLAALALVLCGLFALTRPSPLSLGITLFGTVVGYFVPELLLYSRGIERREKITNALADTLDQMTIAVEAGLGFDAAMSKAGKNGQGPLAEELLRTLAEIQVGHSRREAYEGLSNRAAVPDLRRFVRAVIQADAHGVAITDVLRTQAAEMRAKRRSRAEEKAMKIPVKVLFPLMFCILPVLFIVLLGPAVMNIVATFT